MKNLVDHIKTNFISLGYAEWIDNKGLQINAKDVSKNPGVYVMMDENDIIQKVGKSSAGLKRRLGGYKSFDKSYQRALNNRADGKLVRIDESHARQRRAIKENDIKGLYVYFLAAEEVTVDVLGFETVTYSFDAHALEYKIKEMVKESGHPLHFGNQ